MDSSGPGPQMVWAGHAQQGLGTVVAVAAAKKRKSSATTALVFRGLGFVFFHPH